MTEQKNTHTLPGLDPAHYKELSEGSGISDEVIQERGYYTITKKTELKRLGFGTAQQQVPAIGMPVRNKRGEWQFTLIKPDNPRIDPKNGRIRKYEFPAKTKMALDIPERSREHIDDPYIPAVYTEGIKKVDAGASQGMCTIGVIGTWNWRGTNEKGGKTALPDLEEIAHKDANDEGRITYLIFDSDIMLKISVYNALKRFRELLLKYGADAWVVYVPPGPNGEKQGLDDFLCRGGTWDDIKMLAQRELRKPPQQSSSGRDYVSKHLPDAPVSENFVVPAGYEALLGGIVRYVTGEDDVDPKPLQVTTAPLLIAGRSEDVNSGVEYAELVYLRAGEWKRLSVSRATIANSRSIVELAERGVPVNSSNARDVVEFLHEFEAANLEHMPHARTSSVMGWLGRNLEGGFLCGRKLIRGDGSETIEAVDLASVDPADWPEGVTIFRGHDEGDEQLADAFRTEGTFEGWTEIAKDVKGYPKFKLAALTALAPALMPIIGAANFIFDLSHPTSGGKSTAIRFAGSIWGNPIENVGDSVVATWDATRVWIERASGILNNLPLILDETKRAKDPRHIAQTIYDVASGRSRGRGSKDGTSGSASWRLTLLSTGEQPITSFSNEGGALARVMGLWGSPFEARGKREATLSAKINDQVANHYGHVGPRFVTYLAENRDKWPEWKKRYQMLKTCYTDTAEGNAVMSRKADYLAALVMTSEIAHKAELFPWDNENPVDSIYDELAAESAEADRAAMALRAVVSWAHANRAAFQGSHRCDQEGEPLTPPGGFAGRWGGSTHDSTYDPDELDEEDDWAYIAFYEHKLKKTLQEMDFEPESTLRTWRDRDWLDIAESDKQKRFTKQKWVLGKKTWVIIIKREAIKQVDA